MPKHSRKNSRRTPIPTPPRGPEEKPFTRRGLTSNKLSPNWRKLIRALAFVAYFSALLATVWLYFGSAIDSIYLLLLELGPRWLLALGFLPLMLVPMSARWRVAVIGVGSVACFALVDLRFWGCVMPVGAAEETLQIGSYNTGGGFIPPTELLLWYNEQRLDLLFMQEVGKPERLDEAAQALGLTLNCQSKLCVLTQHDISGELILNRRDLGGWGGYAARFEICRQGSCWPLINLHLATPRHAIEEVLGRQPFTKAREFLKVRALESSIASLATQDAEAVIAGDFNMTQQSPIYRTYWSQWQNAFGVAGCGFGSTKFSSRLETRIDHILAGSRWSVRQSTVHDSLGGDHRPITAILTPRPTP